MITIESLILQWANYHKYKKQRTVSSTVYVFSNFILKIETNKDKYTDYSKLKSAKLKHAANIISISQLKLVTDVSLDNTLLTKNSNIWFIKIEKTKPIYDIQKHSVNKFLNFVELHTNHKLSSNLFKFINTPTFLKLIKRSKFPIYYKELYYNFKDIAVELSRHEYTIVFDTSHLSIDQSYNYIWNFVGNTSQKNTQMQFEYF